MPTSSLTILYVADATASAGFYQALLGQPPAEASPGFAMFVLPGGMRLGLWTRAGVLPVATAAPGAGELAFTAVDVDAVHADWSARGLAIAQLPADLEFGRTFVALDPDGHRLRVLAEPVA